MVGIYLVDYGYPEGIIFTHETEVTTAATPRTYLPALAVLR